MSLVRIHIAEQQRGSYYYQQFPEPPSSLYFSCRNSQTEQLLADVQAAETVRLVKR